ncbi:hypothetical protein [Geothrix sp. PMB-07]|uniref:hypothetical protein n=1 Tax=Geothrix sp. PMB-07 TaxID=3068640 RepID=UPI002742623E|nr:hypothetical protein [Geothrix sp. PMB-07]WLT31130.1 hypothetical protein Q9293_15545 [Geothrix sp. PMB-07]
MAQDLKTLRNLLKIALELRWKRRNDLGLIMCGPEDVESIKEGIASGADVISTDDDYARYEIKENAAKNQLTKTACELLPSFKGIEFDELNLFLSRCRFKYHDTKRSIRKIERSKEARADLQNIMEKAYNLAIALLEVREGAREILSRNRYPVARSGVKDPTDANGAPLSGTVNIAEWQELREFGDLFREQSKDSLVDLSFTPSPGLLEDAEAFNLPWVIPYDPDRANDDDGMHDYEWSLGGPWIVRLEALAELAAANADHLGNATGKGGRESFGSRLHGSPEDQLAQACNEFANTHGCESQTVVLKMVQAVMVAEHGKEMMKMMDGRPSKDKGRKAVRKVAQTDRKTRPV